MGKNQSKEEKKEEVIIAQSAGGQVNFTVSHYEALGVTAFVMVLFMCILLLWRYCKKGAQKTIRKAAREEFIRISMENLMDKK